MLTPKAMIDADKMLLIELIRNPILLTILGIKIYIDQNEKLIHFGVTQIIAVDGYSGMIVSHATINAN